MEQITVQASRQYDVLVGSGLLDHLGEMTAALIRGRNAVVISDTNVWPIYGKTAITNLSASAFQVERFVIPAGEENKNLATYGQLLNFLSRLQLSREDVIIALGGGVVGDLAGFAAATYLRGIAYIQVPTSLLAMVDSSVGGKTAIDLPAGKNLAGAFYQPSLVLCDTDALTTLPRGNILDGCAEIIKYGILYDKALFYDLLHHGLNFDLEYVISKCVAWKGNAVRQDEFDNGARKLLNLGHTFAHAIEQQSCYEVSHGKAVSIGIAMAARVSWHFGLCSEQTQELIIRILADFGLPVSTDYKAAELSQAALADKKRRSNTIDLILPESIGKCKIVTVDIHQLDSIFEAGL